MPSLARTLLGILFILSFTACGDSSTSTPEPDAGMSEVDMSDPCANACAERTCGMAPGCDVDCGTCENGDSCDDGQCVCVPQCDSKVCGPDGCGGTCGECGSGEECNTVMGTCADTCMPASCEMQGLECGMAMDGCGGELMCPSCTGDDICLEGACVTPAPPTFEWVAPAGRDELGDSFELQWIDSDPDSDATISLYYSDTKVMGATRTPIVEGISEDDMADSFTWDTTMLDRGLYWLTAEIDDGDDTVTVRAAEPVVKAIPSCAPASNTNITFDVPEAVEISLRPLINGQPLVASDLSASEYLTVTLRDSISGNQLLRYRTWDFSNGVAVLPSPTYDVLPGYYDIEISGLIDSSGRLLRDVEIRSDTTIDVDIPTVDVTIDVTYDGQAISSANTGNSDLGTIELAGRTIQVWDPGTNAPRVPVDLTIVPGVYPVDFLSGSFQSVGATGFNWPEFITSQKPRSLGTIDLTQAGNYTVDVPVSKPEISLTFEGQPLTQQQIDSNITFTIAALGTRPDISFNENLYYTRQSGFEYPFSPVLITGEYLILVRVCASEFGLPAGSCVVAPFEQTIDDNDLTLDIDLVEVTFAITLDGQPEANLTSTSGDTLSLALYQDPRNRTFSFDTTSSERTYSVPAGSYEIRLGGNTDNSAGDPGITWPVGRLEIDGFDTSQSTWSIDLESTTATVGLLREGVVPMTETEATGGDISVETAGWRGGTIYEAWDPAGSQVVATTTTKLFKRPHDVVFQSPDRTYPAAGSWPFGRLIVEDHDFDAQPMLLLDPVAEAVTHTLDVTYNGANWDQTFGPLGGQYTYSDLEIGSTTVRIPWPQYPVMIDLLPGDYYHRYYVQENTLGLPIGVSSVACFTVN